MIRGLDLVRSWDIPKRYLSIVLYDGREGGLQSKKELSRLGIEAKINFQTHATVYGMVPESNINITGLTRDVMCFLSTSYTYWAGNVIYNRIVIDAGYEGKHAIIYDGNIEEATPNLDSADFNIFLKCSSYQNYFNRDVKSINKDGEATVNEIARKIAKEMGDVVVVGELPDSYKVVDFNMQDTNPINQIRYLASQSDTNIYLENNRLYLKEKDKENPSVGKIIIDSSQIIGAPIPTNRGCRVKIRMNPNVVCGAKVELKSSRFDTINWDGYYLASYSHTGETKGRAWFTTLELTRTKIFEKVEGGDNG